MDIYGISHAGMERKINQDCFRLELFEDGAFCAVVCDGMGGAAAGEVASEMAAEVFMVSLSERVKAGMKIGEIRSLLSGACKKANEQVYHASVEKQEQRGMGTTVVAAVCSSGKVVVCNIGDSRAYLVTESGMEQVTADHSLVAEMIQRGEISPHEAQTHPNRNIITRVLGVEPKLKGDFFSFELLEGEALLLCSDGLTNELSDQQILEILNGSPSAEDAGNALISAANDRGGRDNITVVVAKA